MSRLRRLLAPRTVAHAHCDIPCGVYDPQQARIEAESCYKIIQKYNDSTDDLFRARCIDVKEERAELTKHHIDVMWHDYFKPEHVEKFPDLHDVCWKASKQASQVKRTVDLDEAQKLLDLIDQIDTMWRETGGPTTTRMQLPRPDGPEHSIEARPRRQRRGRRFRRRASASRACPRDRARPGARASDPPAPAPGRPGRGRWRPTRAGSAPPRLEHAWR